MGQGRFDRGEEDHPADAAAGPINNLTATPYASQRDWNRLEKEMEAELEKDKPEGEEALNKLFAEIYGKATPETRRAMNKSFQTSDWEVRKLPQKDSGT